MTNVRNCQSAGLQPSAHSFEELLKTRPSNVLRDSFVLISPENSPTRTLTAGYTTIYPGCRTAGHSHAEYEEIYYITKGAGVMKVGDEEFQVRAGDCFLVPAGLFHATVNPHLEVMEYFWVISSNQDSTLRSERSSDG
jgi:mannose-6-phosphate isomerase-like protein (cupin superfamily)